MRGGCKSLYYEELFNWEGGQLWEFLLYCYLDTFKNFLLEGAPFIVG